jgi:CRISPR-associated protein Cas2
MAAGVMFWVVSYDIPNDRRRRKVSKILEGYGHRVQYSVFECELDEAKCDKLEQLLLKEINKEEDDIRLYPLNRADIKRVRVMGRARLQREQPYHIV